MLGTMLGSLMWGFAIPEPGDIRGRMLADACGRLMPLAGAGGRLRALANTCGWGDDEFVSKFLTRIPHLQTTTLPLRVSENLLIFHNCQYSISCFSCRQGPRFTDQLNLAFAGLGHLCIVLVTAKVFIITLCVIDGAAS